jgi:quinol monooxygenase YgiN
MIIITGSVLANASNRAAIEAESIAHCKRSRAEPGCIAHNVYADCEAPDRLVFLEVWADADAVKVHFALPASGAFVRAISALSSEPPKIKLYTGEEVPMASLLA